MNIQGKTDFHRRLLGAGLAVLICCSALAGAAGAGTEPTRRSVTVSYGDLNLANPAGVERLYQRLRQAANRVCGDPVMVRLSGRAQCTQHAVEEAVRSIDNRNLTALHQERTSHRFG
jgi:UrcA family protein